MAPSRLTFSHINKFLYPNFIEHDEKQVIIQGL